jgi:hypothetical protein
LRLEEEKEYEEEQQKIEKKAANLQKMLAMSRSRSPVKKGKGEDILEDSLNNRT